RCIGVHGLEFMELSLSLAGTGLVLSARSEGLMHYHVVLREVSPARPGKTEMFEMLDEAEAAAQLLSERYIQPSWIPSRYPGRASRLHEVAVYLDRRALSRREVTILRCDGTDRTGELACYVERNGDALWPSTYFHARNAGAAAGAQSTH